MIKQSHLSLKWSKESLELVITVLGPLPRDEPKLPCLVIFNEVQVFNVLSFYMEVNSNVNFENWGVKRVKIPFCFLMS